MMCGHCEAFCPQQALVLDFNINSKIDCSASTDPIEPQRLALYMKNRRSIRHFTKQTVSREVIMDLLETVSYAPSGGNSQTVTWLVVHDPLEVKKIAGLTVDWMRTLVGTPHPLGPYVNRIIAAWDKGIDPICHNAPHLVFALLPKSDFVDDRTDGIIALTHFDLLAPAYGIGACWAGFIRFATDSYKPLQDAISLPENKKVAYALFFGYPSILPTAIPRRKLITVSWQ
jgi:nitroreductase